MKRNRLLIIDDDPLICKTLENIAEKAGFEVMSTDSAFSFFSQLELFNPSLVLLNVEMTELKGMDVMLRLAELHTQAKLIITNTQQSGHTERATQIAADSGLRVLGALEKPFSAANLKYLLTLHLSQFDKTRNTSQEQIEPNGSDWTPTLEDIIRVVENDEITLNFQPKLHCASGNIIGFEALARWNVPGRGHITPSLFVPLAEQNHLYSVMTRNVARQGIKWLAQLNKTEIAGAKPGADGQPHAYTLAFNISTNALYDLDMPQQFREICNDLGVPPALITLEVSEPDSIRDLQEFINALERFHGFGFRLSLDDFGTGHMAVRELVRTAFKEVKIDRKFIDKCDESAELTAIVNSCIDIANNLKLEIVAEGIETQKIQDLMKSKGCYGLQGYFISKPLAANKVASWLTEYYASASTRP